MPRQGALIAIRIINAKGDAVRITEVSLSKTQCRSMG
jgi:hypothetical protein